MPVCVDLSLETEDSDSFLQFCSLCSKFLESPSFRCSSLIKESIKPFKLQCLKHMIMVWTWVDSGDFILTQVTHKAIYRNQHFASLCQVHFLRLQFGCCTFPKHQYVQDLFFRMVDRAQVELLQERARWELFNHFTRGVGLTSHLCSPSLMQTKILCCYLCGTIFIHIKTWQQPRSLSLELSKCM